MKNLPQRHQDTKFHKNFLVYLGDFVSLWHFFVFKCGVLIITLFHWGNAPAQNTTDTVVHIGIGATSTTIPEVFLTLIERFQRYTTHVKSPHDKYDNSIYSPKSAIFLSRDSGSNKLYINSLEGFSTSVYDLDSMKRIQIIKHKFRSQNAYLFSDTTVFGYKFQYRKKDYNIFSGKPVESCFSHSGKYLWITYYRRDYDQNAASPSALAIVDTESDKIIRVMPTGPLPKMITASPDNKYIAVTHWGDNTIGLIDISSDSVANFKYIKHLVVEKQLKLKYSKGEKINRDHNCGYCLRGTVFTPDSAYLLVARMGGGGIAVFDLESKSYIGTVFGMQDNIRHIIICNNELFIGTNSSGYVQKTNLEEFLKQKLENKGSNDTITDWKSCYAGIGVRTIACTSDGKYVFAAVNNESKIVAIRSADMKIVATIKADSYPVGLSLSDDNSLLTVTSQGKKGKGGNSVMVFKVEYN